MLNLKSESALYICQYCQHKFTKEKTLATHLCEPKRRELAKNEKHVIAGYHAYMRFYQITQNNSVIKTYEEFARSPYYNAFVKFGSFVHNINPLYPEQFVDWVIKSGTKLDHWCREELYERYVINLIHTESAETAVERSLKYMQEWADKNNSLWNHYFKYVSTNRAVFDIKDGKISPWLILNCTTGKEMLDNFNDEQLSAIGSIINPTVWVKKFKQSKFDMELVKEITKQGNL